LLDGVIFYDFLRTIKGAAMKCLMNAWAEHEKVIFLWFKKNLKSHELAEDLSQELFIKSMQTSDKFCDLEDSKSWLFVMAKNLFIDHLRKNKQKVISIDEINSDDHFIEAEDEPAVVLQLQHCLPKVLPKLSDSERYIIESCDLNGMSQKEFARVNGISYSTAKSQLQRARKKLEAILTQECGVRYQEKKVCCFNGGK
jgi:RNA polymerase sigma-70 factor (ECF subfamily)